MIYDSKWLNSTVTMKKIEEQLQERMNHIGQDVFTIQQLPEFSFEAMEIYKKTLDLSQAIQEGQRLADIQKRKKEYEERELEKAKIAESERVAKEEAAEAARREAAKEKTETPAEMQQEPAKPVTPITQTIDFRVTGTLEQFVILRKFLEANNIQYGPVPKEE